MTLGRFERVDLREYFSNEASDFTPWLSDPHNIDLLADEIGIGIQNIQTEASVGRFKVDILAEEENTSRKIIIGNQLEITDHAHLGQLITYASGLEAEFVIWIVREAKEEHRQAFDWLNEHTDEHINFFLVVVELWRIGNSPAAPRFSIISRPNEWRRSVRTSTQAGNLTDTGTKQLEFWQQFKEVAATSYPNLRLRTPRPQHYFDVPIGRGDCHIALTIDSRNNKIGCELYIPDSKKLYQTLFANKDKIEAELGLTEPLEWQELPKKKASRIKIFKGFQFADDSTWVSDFSWLINTCVKFKTVFAKNWQPPSGQ
jgi:hypothetical protein